MSNLHTCITPNTTIQELSTQDLENCNGGSLPLPLPPFNPDIFGGGTPIDDLNGLDPDQGFMDWLNGGG
jgi:hypothetical protein